MRADERESRLDAREKRVNDRAEGLQLDIGDRLDDSLAALDRPRQALHRSRLRRTEAAIRAEDQLPHREQAEIDRETADSEQRRRPE